MNIELTTEEARYIRKVLREKMNTLGERLDEMSDAWDFQRNACEKHYDILENISVKIGHELYKNKEENENV